MLRRVVKRLIDIVVSAIALVLFAPLLVILAVLIRIKLGSPVLFRQARTGYPADRIAVVPNSCDIKLFQVPPDAGRAIRSRYDWLGDWPMLLYTGAMGIANGTGYLARLVAATLPLDPEIRFVVVGGGAEETKVRDLARELGVLDRNFFMIGFQPKIEIPAWLAATDLCVCLFLNYPELQASSPNKAFDAMAAGKPLVINYEGWIRDLIATDGIGLHLPPEDFEAATAVVVRHAHDTEWKQKAGTAARKIAETRFFRDQLFQFFHQTLQEAVQP